MTEQLSLAADFEPATLDQWRRLALGVLRKSGAASADGRSASSRAEDETPPEAVDDLLSTTTYDGIRIPPLYEPARATSNGASSQQWDVRQRHGGPDPSATRHAILDDLEGGATSIWLDLNAGGWAPDDPADLGAALHRLLDGVFLDLAGIVLDAGPQGADGAATALVRLAADRGTPASGNLGLDPYCWAARDAVAADLAGAVAWARRCAAEHDGLRALTVDATPYHEAGGSDAQELAVALATGVAYLRALTDAGLSIDAALDQLEFRYAASADQFLTIAKFRAARRTWARVTQACGASAEHRQRQHAVTSAAMMAARDPWTNMLRTTLACFGAAIGGADAITVTPFDSPLGQPDSFGRRIARNTQTLLHDEAHLGRVADPASGSGYVEGLTESLSQSAWDWFQEIERAGGIGKALESGLIAQRLEQTWTARRANIAHRRDAIVGVSEFPNLPEVRPSRQPARVSVAKGLPRHRYAEAFEALRDAADAHAAATGARPRVMVAALGSPAAYGARVAFAQNLFAAGGIETVVVPAARASGAVVCLAGPDAQYAESAVDAARTLRGSGAEHVWLAGKPAGYDGVDSYVYTGCDAVAVLTEVLHQLGVAV